MRYLLILTIFSYTAVGQTISLSGDGGRSIIVSGRSEKVTPKEEEVTHSFVEVIEEDLEPVVVPTPTQKIVTATPPNRYIQWPGWGQIDLATYNRNCNCSMCNTIRGYQQQYQQDLRAYNAAIAQPVYTAEAVEASEAPTPYPLVEQTVQLLQLNNNDVVADLGCGDGRILIAAVKKYKCRGVGVEINPAIARVARQRVVAANMADRITIITGDAVQFDPDKYRVTAVTAFLYPELLKRLVPTFKRERIRVVATPYHEIPGISMSKHGDVYVWRKAKLKRRQQFLVSELYCTPCKAAKANFKALGWPEENILTIEQCYQRFGFRVPKIPYLFDDPNYK